MFITKVIEIGNSLGVIIPSYLCKELGWHAGTKVTVTLTPDKRAVIVREVKK